MEKKQRLSALFGAKVEGASPIEIREMSPALQESLKAFDLDGDGKVDSYELARAAEAYRQAQTRARRLNRMLLAGSALLLVVLAAFSGLVFTVVELTKESHVTEGTLTVKNSNETVRTSQALQQDRLCSQASDAVFREMRYLDITSPTGASLSFLVQGWARMPKAHSMHGSIVAIVTQIGTVTIDGSTLKFEDDVAPIFSRAGFEVAASKRSLAGAYDIFAMFNNVVVVDECGHEMSESMEPGFPEGNFVAMTTVYTEMPNAADSMIARPQGLKTIDGQTYSVSPTKIYNDAINGRTREEASFPALNDNHKRVTIESAATKFSFQVDSRSGIVAYCDDQTASKNPDEGHDMGEATSYETELVYMGATTCPVAGGECRKFGLKGAEESEFGVYDARAEDGSYMIKEVHDFGYIMVFNSIQKVAAFEQSDFMYPTCPGAEGPWSVPGTLQMSESINHFAKAGDHMIVGAEARNAIRNAADPGAAFEDATLHLGLVSMGIDGHDFATNAVNATAYGFQDFEALKAAVNAKGMELVMAGGLQTADKIYGQVEKPQEEAETAPFTEGDAHGPYTPEDVAFLAAQEEANAEAGDDHDHDEHDHKTGRKLSSHYYHKQYDITLKKFGVTVTVKTTMACVYSVIKQNGGGGDCQQLGSTSHCDPDFYLSFAITVENGAAENPCRMKKGNSRGGQFMSSSRCPSGTTFEMKFGFEFAKVASYMKTVSKLMEGLKAMVKTLCYFYFGVVIECGAVGCFGVQLWRKMGGSITVVWSLSNGTGSATGCFFATFGMPQTSTNIKIWRKKFKFSSEKVFKSIGWSVEVKFTICISVSRLYDSEYSCYYVNLLLTFTASISGINIGCCGVKVSAKASLQIGVSLNFSPGVKMGSKWCYQNYIKYMTQRRSSNGNPALKPMKKLQFYIKINLSATLKVWRYKKTKGLSKKLSTKWFSFGAKFEDDDVAHHAEVHRYFQGWKWRASTLSGRQTYDYGQISPSVSSVQTSGYYNCKDGCKL